MMKFSRKGIPIALAAVLVAGGYTQSVLSAEGEIEEVVVTGSYIKRSAQEQPSPIDVYDRSEWEEQGSPQAVEIIQNTPAMSGTLNQSEQYAGSGTATGLKNINIRGLGAERSLVLLNGKRMAVTGASVGKGAQYVVDIGAFPNIAMERIELLKNGGAVTYGTDAIAGVWNYVTRSNFEGFELSLNHGDIDGSEGGDDTFGAIFGIGNDTTSWVTSFEYEERGRLSIPNNGQAVHDGTWPLGISSFGNPGTFHVFGNVPYGGDPTTIPTIVAGRVVDPGCGQYYDVGNSIAAPLNLYSQCGYTYMPFANVIDPQKRLKFFSEMKVALNDTTEVYGEVLWHRLTTAYEGSPSYPPTNPGAGGGFTFVPLSNPALQDLIANHMTADQAAAYTAAGGASWWGRSLAGEGPRVEFPREHKTLRVVGGARGQIPFEALSELDFDFSVAYSEVTSDLGGYDVLTDRFGLAVAGLGGANCARVSSDPSDPANDAVRGNADSGCYWFYPYSKSIGAAPGSAFYNDPDVRDWFTGDSSGITENRYAVSELVVSGEMPVELSGGNIAFATGYQYRWYESEYDPTGDNRIDGPGQDSPFHFLGVSLYNYLETRNWAFFAEFSLPLTNNLDVDLGVRHEDYGLDSVTKPKIAARWDASDWLTLRASYEEVFRLPVIPSNPQVNLELYAPRGEYLSIETPVPTNLDPEASTNINFGAIIRPLDGMTLTVDYYNLALEGPFGREAATCSCADLILDNSGNVTKIVTDLINGDDVDTDGIDIELDYRFDTGFGSMNVGLNGNFIMSYDVAGELYYSVGGRTNITGGQAAGSPTGGAYDAVGKYNVRAAALPIEVRSMPEYKYNAWVGWSNGNQSARLYARYIDGMDVDESSTAYGVAGLTSVDSMLSFDAHYTLHLMEDKLTLNLSALNLTDERAPLAPHEQAYDAYTHNPIGRVVKVGLRYKLGD